MERLEFIKENWFTEDDVSQKWATTMRLPDYRGEEKECWHLRGRGWRWVTLKSNYSDLKKDQEYVLTFWAKFDYYSGRGTKCFILLYEDWETRITYDIHPNCPNVVGKSGDWFLYQFTMKLECGSNLKIEIISYEANIAILPANPEDEKNPFFESIQDKNEGGPYFIDQELPFKEYKYLEQRMVKYYSDLLAPYVPSKEIKESSQSEYYKFVEELYQRLFLKPELFFTKLYEDDAHPNRFNCREYGKPELKIHMKKDRDKIEELFQLLLTIITTSEVAEEGVLIATKLSKRQKSMLTFMNFKVTDGIIMHQRYSNIGQVMKYLARKEKPLWSLMYCWFDDTYPYFEKTYEKFYDKEQFLRLTNWLHENGYDTSIGSCSGITLDYYKSIRKKESPIGYAIHGDKFHYGFTFEYRPDSRVRQHCEPRIIQFATMLKRYEELSESSKQLILQRTKHCDGCRYCIQTDKSGKRALAAIKFIDGTYRCPYYPGFNYTFERLTKEDVDGIIAFLIDLETKVI